MSDAINIKLMSRQVVLVTLLTIIIVDVLNVASNVSIVENASFTDTNTLDYYVVRISIILCDILVLFLQFSIFIRNLIDTELQKIYNIFRKDNVFFKYSKDNINILNTLIHDLKYMINNSNISKNDGFELINNHIKEYDVMVTTGNKTLDIILTEKNYLALKNGITPCIIAHGELLNFMQERDIYTLIGNLFDNAIESVMAVEDENKRNITLKITEKDNYIEIQEENNYTGKLKFENESLVSSKTNKENHGYGIKSMSYIAKKYGGTLSFKINEQLFLITINIPKQ